MYGKLLATKIRIFTMLLLVIFFTSGARAGTIKGCNANGTYTTFDTSRFCTDPASGLSVNYIVFSGFTWTTNDGVQHHFPIGTSENSSNGSAPDGGVLCGPNDIATGSATASDGSGFTMVVNSYFQADIYDRNGNPVFVFGEGTTCS